MYVREFELSLKVRLKPHYQNNVTTTEFFVFLTEKSNKKTKRQRSLRAENVTQCKTEKPVAVVLVHKFNMYKKRVFKKL